MTDFCFICSALYYNNGVASFNSSGRSSNCDEGDMQSDISLEEDVNDLNHKVTISGNFLGKFICKITRHSHMTCGLTVYSMRG